jgi:hypothetical protein
MEEKAVFKIAFDGQVFEILADFIAFDRHDNRMLLRDRSSDDIGIEKVVANFPLDKSALIEII